MPTIYNHHDTMRLGLIAPLNPCTSAETTMSLNFHSVWYFLHSNCFILFLFCSLIFRVFRLFPCDWILNWCTMAPGTHTGLDPNKNSVLSISWLSRRWQNRAGCAAHCNNYIVIANITEATHYQLHFLITKAETKAQNYWIIESVLTKWSFKASALLGSEP